MQSRPPWCVETEISTTPPVAAPRRPPWLSLPPRHPRHQFVSFRSNSRNPRGSPSSGFSPGPRRGRLPSLGIINGGTRIYTPWITLSLFLSQVLADDHSCDQAVDRFQKFRYDQGLPAVAPDTAATARLANACPRMSPGNWSAVRLKRFRKRPTRLGSFTADLSRSSTARPSPFASHNASLLRLFLSPSPSSSPPKSEGKRGHHYTWTLWAL